MTMRTFLLLLEIVTAILLVIAVLLHSAKGEGLGGIGGSAKLFGSPKGMEEGLDRITWGLTAAFLLLALILAIVK
jgi:preprotein translocase subunit SecG